MKVKNFKQFESNKEFLSEDDMRDLFVELLDQDYKIEFHDTASESSFFFDIKKTFSEETFKPITKGSAYGVSDIQRIQEEPPKFLTIIEDVKLRLNEIGYEIGFEFEFHFGLTSMIFAACHAQHKDYIPDSNYSW